LHRGLAKIPADRFPSCSDFVTALEEASNAKTIPLDRGAPLWRIILVWVASVAGLIAGGTLAYLGWSTVRGFVSKVCFYAAGFILVFEVILLIRIYLLHRSERGNLDLDVD
jgi:hypothetical protein